MATERAPDSDSKARIFISYSRKDLAFADRLEAALKARGFEPLIDRTEIYAFEDWWKRITALIGRADTIVFVLSPDGVTSEVAQKEVAYAVTLNKRLAPIVYRRVEDRLVPEPLRRLNFIFFDDPTRFEPSADALAEALQTDIGWIRRHTELGEAGRRWLTIGRPVGLLLRPPVLEEAEAWITFRPHGAPAPPEETQAFIAESRKAETERMKAEARAKTWRRRAQTAIYVMLIGIILGLVGWINQESVETQWRWYMVTRPYAQAQVWPYALTAAKEKTLRHGDSFKECATDCPEMVVLPAGSFMMGSPASENRPLQKPQHEVTISEPFAVSKFEVTFADWDACVVGGGCNGYRPNDAGWGRRQQPVMYVTWDDAQRYVAWLSQVTGKTYRLLSEAEYEYAARAGTQTAYPWGDDVFPKHEAMANCDGCRSEWDKMQAAPVGSFAPNAFGLYDMAGNVWKWVEDCAHRGYDGAPTDGSAWIEGGNCTDRILRGGSWVDPPDSVRSSFRQGISAAFRNDDLGFRIARTLLAP